MTSTAEDVWPVWDSVAMHKERLKTVPRGPWRPLRCLRCEYPMDFDFKRGALGVFECPVCRTVVCRQEVTWLWPYLEPGCAPSKEACSRTWKVGWTMGDAIGHGIRAKEEAEKALLDRGWVRHDKGSGLVFWTKDGVSEEPLWRHQALEKEFPQ